MSNGDGLSLRAVYKGWDVYQQKLVSVVAPLTAEQLQLSAGSELRPIHDLIAHIIGCRAGWFTEVLGEGGTALKELAEWDEKGAPTRTPEELVQGLETTWQTIWECLGRWTTADLEQEFHPEWHGETYTFTRQWVLWHVLEHDMYHGGELGFSMGIHKIPAIDL